MNHLKTILGTATLLIFGLSQMQAQVLWSDNFTGYNLGSLDSNDGSGPNQGANGTGANVWWGVGPPNSYVATSSSSGITPYPGNTRLITANSGAYFGEDILNLAHRFNGGNNFQGNISLSWAFYDPAGAVASSGFKDFVILGGYSAPDGYTATADYTGTGEDLQSTYNSGVDDLLCLGGYSGGNSSFYQVRVLNTSTANHGASVISGGWYNTTAGRTVGWHTASIVLGAPNGANTPVSMFIDGNDVLDQVLGPSSMDAVNSLIVDGGWGSLYGAYDNFQLTQTPEPGALSLLVCAGLIGFVLRRRK